MASTIRAAGVVLLRRSRRGIEVCILHRPRHNDWSLPKGKVEGSESLSETAHRETVEETGSEVALGPPLPGQRYRVEGRLKTVSYWLGQARPGGPGFKSNREVDRIEWVTPARAKSRLSYARDRELVVLAAALPETSPLIVLRHAEAVKRTDFNGKDDTKRPLNARGRTQAKKLVDKLLAFGITEVRSSDSVRCLETVAPLAKSLGAKVIEEPLMSEEAFGARPKSSVRQMLRLARDSSPMVVCSHRPLLPEVLAELGDHFDVKGSPAALKKPMAPGCYVVFHRELTPRGRVTGRVLGIERYDA